MELTTDARSSRENGNGISTDRSEDVTLRRALADADTDACVSNHASDGATTNLHGIQTAVAKRRTYTSDREALDDVSIALATAIHEEPIEQTKARDRTVIEQSYYVLQDTQAPAALVEVGFLTHPEEGARLATTAYQEQLVQAIADGLLRFLQQ